MYRRGLSRCPITSSTTTRQLTFMLANVARQVPLALSGAGDAALVAVTVGWAPASARTGASAPRMVEPPGRAAEATLPKENLIIQVVTNNTIHSHTHTSAHAPSSSTMAVSKTDRNKESRIVSP